MTMNLISIRLPDGYINTIDEMVLQGRYASRSEAIRLALRDYYREHFASKPAMTDINIPDIDYRSASSRIIFEE
ncbi:MAG: ribbon-helix-helix domain-containing protein [Candidatus Heimdallarchaeaceae archaeon]